MDKVKSVWNWIQEWTGKYVGGLVMDQKDGKSVMSLGRSAMVLILGCFVWVWRRSILDGEAGVELPDGMLQVFFVLAGYVFGTKITSKFGNKKGDSIEISGGDDK